MPNGVEIGPVASARLFICWCLFISIGMQDVWKEGKICWTLQPPFQVAWLTLRVSSASSQRKALNRLICNNPPDPLIHPRHALVGHWEGNWHQYGGTYFKWLERESQSRCTWNIILSLYVVFWTFFKWLLTFMLFALSTFQSVLKVLCQMHLSVVSFIGTSSRKLTGGFHSYRIKHLKHRHHVVVQSYIAPYKAPVWIVNAYYKPPLA